MRPEGKPEPDETKSPPPFASWSRIYGFVAICFVVEVALFYLFTLYYS